MQPKLKITSVEQGDHLVEALEIAPVVMPDTFDNKGKPIKQNAGAMPLAPVIYPLVDEAEAHLIKALMRSSQPTKSQISLIAYGRMDEDKVKEVLAMIETLNTKMLPAFGTGVVADQISDSTFIFSLRHTQEMWGGRSANELNEATTFRAPRSYKPTAPVSVVVAPVAEIEIEPEELDISIPRIVAPALKASAAPPAQRSRRAWSGRTKAPVWTQQSPLPVPDADAVFNFPGLSLLDMPDDACKTLVITPTAAHSAHKRQTLDIIDPVQVLVLQSLIASPAGVIFGRKEVEGLQRSDVANAVDALNDALSYTYSGVSIKRYVMKKHARRSSQGRMVMKFDARKWGPMPQEQAGHGSQVKKYAPKRVSQSDITNAPVVCVEGRVPGQTARLVIKPRAHHKGEKECIIPLLNEAQVRVARAACRRPGSSEVDPTGESGQSFGNLLSARLYINEQLQVNNTGVQLHGYRSHCDHVVLRYDVRRWGSVPRSLAIKGTIAPPKPLEGHQYALGLRRKRDEAAPVGAEHTAPRSPLSRRLPRAPWLKKLAAKKPGQQQDLFYDYEVQRQQQDRAIAHGRGRPRVVKVDPKQLQLPIILDQQLEGQARLVVGAVELGNTPLTVDVTPRQAQLFRLICKHPRIGIGAYRNELDGDAVERVDGEELAAAKIRAVRGVKAELSALNTIIGVAISSVAPDIVPPARAGDARVIAFSQDVHVCNKRVALKVLKAA